MLDHVTHYCKNKLPKQKKHATKTDKNLCKKHKHTIMYNKFRMNKFLVQLLDDYLSEG